MHIISRLYERYTIEVLENALHFEGFEEQGVKAHKKVLRNFSGRRRHCEIIYLTYHKDCMSVLGTSI